jgi:hypothetical protein
MLYIGLCGWYINITITILDIIHRPAFYLKHDVLQTGFCLRSQVESTQLGPVDIGSLCLLTKETEFSHWNVVLNKRQDDGECPEFDSYTIRICFIAE